jgi:hypothetical protein
MGSPAVKVPGLARQQGRTFLEFANPTANRFGVTFEKTSQVLKSAPSQLGSFGCGIKAAFALAQRTKNLPHCVFSDGWVGSEHDGILPQGKSYIL